jgi:hypothetical protein
MPFNLNQEYVDERGMPVPMPTGPGAQIDASVRGLPDTGDMPPSFGMPQAQQYFEQARKPPEWGPGRIAQTILGAPFNLLSGIDQELKGGLGIPTLGDSAAQARAIYATPKSESRAFGQGVADEPDFGDRFLGALTGSSRRDVNAAMAASSLVQQARQAQRAWLRDTKDVMEVKGSIIDQIRDRFRLEQDAKYSDLKNIANINQSNASAGASSASAALSNYRRQLMQEQEMRLQGLAQAFGIDPSLLGRAAAGDVTGVAGAAGSYDPRTLKAIQDLAGGMTGQQRDLNEIERQARDLRGREGAEKVLGVPPEAAEAIGGAAAGLSQLQDLTQNPYVGETGVKQDVLTKRGFDVEDAERSDVRSAAQEIRLMRQAQRAAIEKQRGKFEALEWLIPGKSTDEKLAEFDAETNRLLADLTASGDVSGAYAGRGADVTPKGPAEDAQRDAAGQEAKLIQRFDALWTTKKGFNAPKSGPEYERRKAAYLRNKMGR